MERIGVRELRQHASTYLDLVRAGETVEVTDRGELVARLVPVSRADGDKERLIAAGKLIPASSPSGRSWSDRPLPSPAEGPTNAELLDAERDDRP